jgi:phytoene desaturase
MDSALVIGAGIGGLAAAGRLARAGYEVTVFEKSGRPGGRTNVVETDGFRFDTGPTLFLMQEIFQQTYADLGERMEDYLDLIRMDPTYQVHFHDGSKLLLTADLLRMREQLNTFERGSFEAYTRFLSEGHRHYHASLERFVGRNFRSIFEYLSLANIPMIVHLKALNKHYANVSSYFKDPRLRAAFTFQNMYLGVSPYDALATYSLLQYTELAEGVWFPRGGMYRVIESLASIVEKLGVQFRYNTPVARIKVDGNRATGVVLEHDEFVPGNLVVANADLPYVYRSMLPDNGMVRRLDQLKYTSSALMFYWGVRGDVDPLLPHNVFLADHRYRESFTSIFRDLTLPEPPSIYIHVPSKIDPTCVPPGHSSLMVLVPVGHINEKKPQDWDQLRQRAREAVLDTLAKLGLGDISDRIVSEATLGPPDYQAMNLAKGSAFGLSHNFLQVGYLRPKNRHDHYGNLYFAGASTHPGTGLPMVLLSAQLTVERILQEQR